MTTSTSESVTAFLPAQQNWTLSAAQKLLDLSGGDEDLAAIGEAQLRTALALLHILRARGTAYLADEVGMGKTYVALALIALLRQAKPDLRVLYLTPSRNVREKWARRECTAFNRLLDRNADTHSMPFVPREYNTIGEWVRERDRADQRDTFLSFSAFSFTLDDAQEGWSNSLEGLLEPYEWQGIAGKKADVKALAARRVYERLGRHRYDLLVFDEAHLLRSGDSDRAAFVRDALRGGDDVPVFRASLLLSATPFDRNLGELRRQLKVAQPAGATLVELVEGLEAAHRDPGKRDWSVIQQALKVFMVRRSHELVCGDSVARSRNQYRVERRSEAAIHLRGSPSDAGTTLHGARLLQRLYTAVVQKKLVESSKAAAFPLAMFSAWETYAVAAPAAAKVANDVRSDSLDMNGEARRSASETSKDSDLLLALSDSYSERFHPERPPHPKLEAEGRRLASEAFGCGDKQLVFVRRLRAIDDLKARLDRGYDAWLAAWLSRATGVVEKDWLAYRPVGDVALRTIDAPVAAGRGDDGDPPVNASFENLFCWFFRGDSDNRAQALAAACGRPTPSDLRTALTTRTNWLSVMGEVDWLALLAGTTDELTDEDWEAIAAYASEHNRVSKRTPFDTFRCAQTGWLRFYKERLQARGVPVVLLERLLAYLRAHEGGEHKRKHKPQRLDVKAVREALGAPTLSARLQSAGLLPTLWPAAAALVDAMRREQSGEAVPDDSVNDEKFAEFDLFREVFFALVRLDHPFIDVWLASKTSDQDSLSTARELVIKFVEALLEQQALPERTLSSYRILEDLAQGWKYVLKTNFSDLKSARDSRGNYTHGEDRHTWRRKIASRITPRDPVEWASGLNAKSRPDIAWRFRMPGYPLVLVSTSVFQEGEDLHTFCRHVTHFGISGSPIGIEQKNGRVDRVGSLSQRALTTVREALDENMHRHGIDIRFPHVAESIEWFQIRDLAFRLNEYQRSLHRVGEVREMIDPNMQESLYSDDEIPPQIRNTLRSPFEPDLPEPC
ncbi:MAG TPA: DEAD/DEAH box helicase family protein [Paraburkholderia sp.]|uniref:DEAD/DEAH box helicase family protein n=1 Tax=Paraburkholderia sp. TaxID=1926495 RepID=UPI002B49CAE3|nr:DEAD/DEAH box helicase family protein [Paraburkholderia sp.]HKR38382.1 DEAD/DEAH box helicase family protein [Paraburkholderia sp.]